MIFLETEHLVLKPIDICDAEAIFHFFTPNVTKYMYPAPAKTIDDTLSFIQGSINLRKQGKEIVWVARLKYDDTFVGCFGLHHMDTRTPELGLWIQEGLFGKKLGIEGMSEVIRYAQKNVIHDYFVYPVDRRNRASRNIPESWGGIYKKTYPVTGLSGNKLDIIEYWIYPKLPKEYVKPVILFQGDSITDWGRDRNDITSLGDGYVNIIKSYFPQTNVINRGISGDRSVELMKRWDDDVIKHQPDILSLLCGVNDVWHFYHFGKPMDTDTFDKNYRYLIHETLIKSQETKIVLIEPFSFTIGAFEENWKPFLNQLIDIIRKIALDFNLPLIKMEDHMKSWEKIYGAENLLYDGVHPTALGHQLIAKTIKPIISNLLLEIEEKNLNLK